MTPDAPEVNIVVTPEVEIVEAKVSYTTKELLERIDKRFDKLEGLAEAAATRDQVEKIARRVDKLEREAEGTKAVAAALLDADKSRWSRNEKLGGLVLTIVLGVPTLVSIFNLF